MRIKDESTPKEIKADLFSTTSTVEYLSPLQAAISLPPWGSLLAVGWWGLTCPFHFEVLLSDGSSQAWEKPAVLPHPFNMVLHKNPDLHFPVRRRARTEKKYEFSHGYCTQIQGREHTILTLALPCRRSGAAGGSLRRGAGLHGNATARPLHCVSALIGNARSHPSSKACWKHSRLPGLGTVLLRSWLRHGL